MSRRYCDIHNHLLPDVDDGSRSIEETLRHLREFRAQGIDDLVFSPHLMAGDLDEPGIEAELLLHRRRFAEVVQEAGDDPSLPRLYLGQEILARGPADLVPVVGRADVGMAGGDTLLVEFGFQPGFDGDGVIRYVLAQGRPVVVAHPERYRFGDHDGFVAARRWRDMGASLQVNGGSLAGLYTEAAHTLALRLLEANLVDLVGTDHHGDYRTHSPAQVAEIIAREAGPDRVEALMGTGPRRAVGIDALAPDSLR